jgi:Na+/proline symporter
MAANNRSEAVRSEAGAVLAKVRQPAKVNNFFERILNLVLTLLRKKHRSAESSDADYVFISFILKNLPHGLIGLLIAAFFAAALSSKAAELNALGSTTTIDLYRHVVRRQASDAHYVTASKCFTLLWGLVALAFALFASMSENLIQAVNIVGSLFYGVLLALFVVAFFLRWIGGTSVFWAALVAEVTVLVLYHFLDISYLWYNFIGCAACVLLSLVLEAVLGAARPIRVTSREKYPVP